MKATSRVLLLAAVCFGVFLAGGVVQSEPDQKGASDEIRPLLEKRRDTLKRLVEVVTARYENGAGTQESVIDASNSLIDAELELTADHTERIALLEKQVGNLKDLERYARAKFEAGRVGPEQVLRAEAARLAAEIRLARARAGGKQP